MRRAWLVLSTHKPCHKAGPVTASTQLVQQSHRLPGSIQDANPWCIMASRRHHPPVWISTSSRCSVSTSSRCQALMLTILLSTPQRLYSEPMLACPLGWASISIIGNGESCVQQKSAELQWHPRLLCGPGGVYLTSAAELHWSLESNCQARLCRRHYGIALRSGLLLHPLKLAGFVCAFESSIATQPVVYVCITQGAAACPSKAPPSECCGEQNLLHALLQASSLPSLSGNSAASPGLPRATALLAWLAGIGHY